MKYPNLSAFLLALLLFSISSFSQIDENKDFNCFTVLIGKEATTDGSVMLAHNEDDWGDRVVNWYKVPKQFKTFQGDSIPLYRGHKIAQVDKTNAYLWLEIPELEFSDSYMNEYGVVVVSNACISREDKPELTNGGIGYWLRRFIAERAKTAREAVEIAGEMIETIGYASSGRTYSIADAEETWMLSVVNGKHWVAQRIPDKHLAILPNYYTIKKVNLNDTANFLGSRDLIDYAINRGWYNPELDGEFNFRTAYSDQDNLQNMGNKARYWVSINALSQKQYQLDDDFPFSFVPKKRIELKDIFTLLRNHYEETDLYNTENIIGNDPHQQKIKTVCSNTNQYGFVAHLRNKMPVDIGAVLWLAPRRPCTQAFIPIYLGMNSVSEYLSVDKQEKALENHFNKIDNFEQYSEKHDYVVFGEKANQINANYNLLITENKKNNKKLEEKLLKKQVNFEMKMTKLYMKNPNRVRRKVTNYSNKQLDRIIKNSQ